MKYYIVSGEASGDLHASNLIKAILELKPTAEFRAWAGDLSEAAGATLAKHYKELSFMGFVEVVQNLGIIRKNIAFCKKDVLKYKPDVLILMDFSGFNLRIAKWAKQEGFKICYYIAPQVWASRSYMIHKLVKNTDLIITILPFEKPFYKKYGYEVAYGGHPLLDVIKQFKPKPNFAASIGWDSKKNLIALLPGSRKQEISRMLPEMIALCFTYPDYHFALGMAPAQPESYYRSLIPKMPSNLSLIANHTYDILANAKAGLVTSGTATLETGLFGVPQVVCYKANPISYAIARSIIKVKFISLINLILDRELVTELIQSNYTYDNLDMEFQKVISDPTEIKKGYNKMFDLLGNAGASKKAAQLIIERFPS